MLERRTYDPRPTRLLRSQTTPAARDALAQGGLEKRPAFSILGTRGIPARHGGFETFAEKLAVDLVARGWDVAVYCQTDRPMPETSWNGVRLFAIPTRGDNPLSTILFDLRATLHALRQDRLPLILGYNTALFSLLYRLSRKNSLMNMDGMEWKRRRWSRFVRAWFWLNEQAGCLLSSHLVADHPEIARHLATRVPAEKISTIGYGANVVTASLTDAGALDMLGLKPRRYALVIGRIVPENGILDIVRTWSVAKYDVPLIVLGALRPQRDAYHRDVVAATGDNVRLVGGVYDRWIVDALRLNARFYIHGHHVGGTNPSLVEALGAGSPIVAHDNAFNRGVAGDQALYFNGEAELNRACTTLLLASDDKLDALSAASRARHAAAFQWPHIIDQYERLLLQWVHA